MKHTNNCFSKVMAPLSVDGFIPSLTQFSSADLTISVLALLSVLSVRQRCHCAVMDLPFYSEFAMYFYKPLTDYKPHNPLHDNKHVTFLTPGGCICSEKKLFSLAEWVFQSVGCVTVISGGRIH